MGLFSRGSKSDVPLNGDEWSTNGGSRNRESNAESTEDKRQPAPVQDREEECTVEEAPELEESTVEEAPELEEATSDEDAAPEQADAPTIDEPATVSEA